MSIVWISMTSEVTDKQWATENTKQNLQGSFNKHR